MKTQKYKYKVEVNLYPEPGNTSGTPYFWVIWEVDRSSGVKANSACGWASTPEKAWAQAYAAYNLRAGVSLSKINGIKEVWQIVYTLHDGTKHVGDCFESVHHAHQHAAVVECVNVEGELKPVFSFCVQPLRYIPSNK